MLDNKTVILIFNLVFLLLFDQYACARILGIFPMPGKSHYNMIEYLMKGLAEKGHTVDVVTHFPQKEPFPRFNDLSIHGSSPVLLNNLTMELFEDYSYISEMSYVPFAFGYQLCDQTFKSSALQNLKKTSVKYDLLIYHGFGGDCWKGFAHLFNIPAVTIITSVFVPWSNDAIGNPDNPSYIPNYFLPYSERMTFTERLINAVALVYSKMSYYYYTKKTETTMKDFFGKEIPDIFTLTSKYSNLVLVNSHFSMNMARPLVRNVIEVGGLHIKSPGKIAKKLDKIMNDSRSGVIYFTMGSMLQSHTFSIDKQRALMEAFAELPYTILWKADKNMFAEPIPDNIVFENWLPQMEVLCHPKTKVFITHGGLFGSQESVYCGVPMIGIPIFADQKQNIQSYEKKGIAITLTYQEITKQTVLRALRTVLNDPSYLNNVRRISNQFKDRPMGPLETAIYWIEYILRHKGAPHLRSVGADLPWYRYFLIDVVLITGGLFVLTLFTLYKLLKFIIYTVRKDIVIDKNKKYN